MNKPPSEPKTLISLASRQTWQQLLIWKELKPEKILLLHSSVTSESANPAKRLAAFLNREGCDASCIQIPHDDFRGVVTALQEIAAEHKLNGAECLLNFTGGNKLMATAAYTWACTAKIPACYLERGNQLIRFEYREGQLGSLASPVDLHSCDDLDSADIVRCQLDSSEIERPGELLTLSERGQHLSEKEFKRMLNGKLNEVPHLLKVHDPLVENGARGDHLELLAATVLLWLGVRSIRRSMRIHPARVPGYPGVPPLENEFDLVFNHGGRLWVVDCKDRKPPENLAGGVEKMLKKLPDNPFNKGTFRSEWTKIRSAVTSSPMKVMKEDLLVAQSLGGLLGQVICVRKSEPSDEIISFAKAKGIHIVTKPRLLEEFRSVNGLFD